MPDTAFSLEDSFDTFLKMVQLPFDESRVKATQDVLDAHKAWQLSKFLNFLEVFKIVELSKSRGKKEKKSTQTQSIFPDKEISFFGVKFISAAKAGNANKTADKLNILVVLFIKYL